MNGVVKAWKTYTPTGRIVQIAQNVLNERNKRKTRASQTASNQATIQAAQKRANENKELIVQERSGELNRIKEKQKRR